MTVKRGKIHDYLGMTLDFSDEGSFVVNMEDYLKEVLEGVPADIDGIAATPACDHLFKTCANAPKLNKERGDLYHRVTAQILFACQRGRPDLRTVVSFLTKQVKAPDEDDWKSWCAVSNISEKQCFSGCKSKPITSIKIIGSSTEHLQYMIT